MPTYTFTKSNRDRLTPKQVIELSAQWGLRPLAIADHNTTDGPKEALMAAQKYPGLRVMPGAEMITGIDGAHILGHFIEMLPGETVLPLRPVGQPGAPARQGAAESPQ